VVLRILVEYAGWPKCTDSTDFFFNPKIVRIVRDFFSNCTDCTDMYPGSTHFFFTHLRKFFMKISKKNLFKMKLV